MEGDDEGAAVRPAQPTTTLLTPAEAAVGETVQRLRAESKLTLRTLATRSGFSASFLSQVENGQASPSIASLERLARALGVGLADFFRQETPARGLVMRRSERGRLTSQWSKAQVEPLVPPESLRRLEGILIILEPGGRSGRETSAQPHEQIGLVLEGEVVLSVASAVHVLTVGDAAAIPAHSPHSWENRSLLPVRIALVAARGPR